MGEIFSVDFKVRVTPKLIPEVIGPDNKFAVRQFQLSDLFYGFRDIPAGPLIRANAPDQNVRFAIANSSEEKIKAAGRLSLVRDLVNGLNDEMAQLALNVGVMANLQSARRDVFAFFGESI